MTTSANFHGVNRNTVMIEMPRIVNFFSVRIKDSLTYLNIHSLLEVKMFMEIKASKGNVERHHSNLSSKGNKN